MDATHAKATRRGLLDLPTELLEYISNELIYDIDTFKPCEPATSHHPLGHHVEDFQLEDYSKCKANLWSLALTCRAFAAPATTALYQHVVLRTRTEKLLFLRTVLVHTPSLFRDTKMLGMSLSEEIDEEYADFDLCQVFHKDVKNGQLIDPHPSSVAASFHDTRTSLVLEVMGKSETAYPEMWTRARNSIAVDFAKTRGHCVKTFRLGAIHGCILSRLPKLHTFIINVVHKNNEKLTMDPIIDASGMLPDLNHVVFNPVGFPAGGFVHEDLQILLYKFIATACILCVQMGSVRTLEFRGHVHMHGFSGCLGEVENIRVQHLDSFWWDSFDPIRRLKHFRVDLAYAGAIRVLWALHDRVPSLEVLELPDTHVVEASRRGVLLLPPMQRLAVQVTNFEASYFLEHHFLEQQLVEQEIRQFNLAVGTPEQDLQPLGTQKLMPASLHELTFAASHFASFRARRGTSIILKRPKLFDFAERLIENASLISPYLRTIMLAGSFTDYLRFEREDWEDQLREILKNEESNPKVPPGQNQIALEEALPVGLEMSIDEARDRIFHLWHDRFDALKAKGNITTTGRRSAYTGRMEEIWTFRIDELDDSKKFGVSAQGNGRRFALSADCEWVRLA